MHIVELHIRRVETDNESGLAVLLLPACTESVGVNVAMIEWLPDDCDQTLTVHVAASPPLAARVHVPKRSPVGDDVRATVPTGLEFVGLAVSVTVTISVLACAISTVPGPGLKRTTVDVLRAVMLRKTPSTKTVGTATEEALKVFAPNTLMLRPVKVATPLEFVL